MAEEKKDYYIVADSVEQFKKIEEAYNKFKECYFLKVENAKLLVLENPFFKNKFVIHPYGKFGKITELESKESNLEARTIKSGLGAWVVSVENYAYLVQESNPDFKKE
ncbi:MAG: hypothetical protein Q8O84_04055 [Nanoarchaeota archaeon]|nr:hypothetical protein [Nanoarchaeota archaeon]